MEFSSQREIPGDSNNHDFGIHQKESLLGKSMTIFNILIPAAKYR